MDQPPPTSPQLVLKAAHKLSKSQTSASIVIALQTENSILETKDGYFLPDGSTLISSNFPYTIQSLSVIREFPKSNKAAFEISLQNGTKATHTSLTQLLKWACQETNPKSKSRTSPADLVVCWWYVKIIDFY